MSDRPDGKLVSESRGTGELSLGGGVRARFRFRLVLTSIIIKKMITL